MSNSIHQNIITSLDSELADSVVRLIPERSKILCRMIRFLLLNPLATSSELSDYIGTNNLKFHARRANETFLNRFGYGIATHVPPAFNQDQSRLNRHEWAIFKFSDQSQAA